MFRDNIADLLSIVVVIVALLLVGGSILGQPILLSFVTSDSMSPTLNEGDGFVAIPAQLSGEVQPGDVVVFTAEELSSGGLTTHRVVGKTSEGYITKGDNNPFTDQDSTEPPVSEQDILATAWQPNGQVITIPVLGTAILETRAILFELQSSIANVLGVKGLDDSRQIGTMLVLIGAIMFSINVIVGVFTKTERDRNRSRKRNKNTKPSLQFTVLLLVLIVIIPANAAMLLPSTTHEIPAGEIADENNIKPGETIDIPVSASNEGLITVFILLETSDNSALTDQTLEVVSGKKATATLSTPAPKSTERQEVMVSENRYLLLLPSDVIVLLYELHPLFPVVAINLMLIFGIIAFTLGIAGESNRRKRTVSRDVPLRYRVKRYFRRK